MQARPALVSLVLGAVAATGFAPLDLWPLTLVAIAAWIAIVHAAPSLRAALWRGWMFGLGHFTVNNNWFQHAFDFQDAMPPVLGYFAAVALALYLAVFPMAAAGLAWRFGRGFGGHPDGSVDGGTRVDQVVGPGPDPACVLIFAAGWIASEWLRSVLFTGYAWDPLGVVWLPAIGVARLSATIGTYALSGVTVVAAGAVLMLAQRRWALPAAVIPALVVAALSALWTNAPSASADAPRVRVVQPDIGQEDRSETDGERVLSALEKLSGNPGSTPRLIVWPEGVVRDYLEDGYPFYAYGWSSPAYLRRRIARLLGPDDILLTGGTSLSFDRDDKIVGATNSVFAIDGQARLRGRYDKAHLVPYGEYLPMPWLLKPLGLARLVPGDIDFTSGNGPGNLTLPGFGAVGMQICYEIIFSGRTVDRAHRPRLLFNPSNDAWFGTWGPPQHLAQARMRAIEEGLPIVRATPTGISAVIGADGRLLGTVPHEQAGAVELPIPPALVVTPFARIGNLAAALVAAAMIAIAVALRRRDR